MDRITIVGLGVSDERQLTAEAAAALLHAPRLVLRTARHGVAAYLAAQGVAYESLDGLYEGADDFETLAETAADRLEEMLAQGPVTYGVPGQGLMEDDTVGCLVRRGLVSRVLPGLSALDSGVALAAGQLPALAAGSLRILPAARLEGAVFDAHQPLAVTSLDDPIQAGQVKLALSPVFGDEAPCVLVTGGQTLPIKLYELDRGHALDENSLLVVTGRSADAPMDYDDLLEIVRRLRAPGGCPWDREQTHASLRGSLIEECYEAAETIDHEDWDALANELGDVLLQVAMHGEIASQMDEFSHLTVTDEICRKMIFRHPHVFGGESVADSGQVLENWDKLKQKERGQNSGAEAIQDVAKALPALLRSQKVLKKAHKYGVNQPLELEKQLERLKDAPGETPAGALLLALVERLSGACADLEEALQQETDRYIQRCASQGAPQDSRETAGKDE